MSYEGNRGDGEHSAQERQERMAKLRALKGQTPPDLAANLNLDESLNKDKFESEPEWAEIPAVEGGDHYESGKIPGYVAEPVSGSRDGLSQKQKPQSKTEALAGSDVEKSSSREHPATDNKKRQAVPVVQDDPLLKVAMQNLDAERCVLGAVLIPHIDMIRRREALGFIAEIVRPEDFYLDSHRLIYRAMLRLDERHAVIDHVTVLQELTDSGHLAQVGRDGVLDLLDKLASPVGVEEHAHIVHEQAALRALERIGYDLVQRSHAVGPLTAGDLVLQAQKALSTVNGNGRSVSSRATIAETYDQAVAANAEYLARTEVIERLGYSQASTLFVGGKHHGKSTCIRTIALAVMRGVPVFGRATRQGHVIYAVSDDELASTRMELLRMGWQDGRDPLVLVHKDPNSVIEDPQKALDEIADEALHHKSVLIIFDMLFDFAQIKDEMGYAHTREAVGRIQRVADATKTLTLSSHHSPKYLLDTATAATAALGSQGIAARFSPIILTRRWADGLYTIESTMTRDPRGMALSQRVVSVDENGWAQDGGEFKSWMKWKVYAPRIMGLFEGGEPGQGRTVASVAADLEIPRPEAQNALYQLSKTNVLYRDKHGRSYKYFLRSGDQDGAVTDGSNADLHR